MRQEIIMTLDDMMKVKLTEYGQDIFDKYFDNFPKTILQEQSSDGYYFIPLYMVMQIFGSACEHEYSRKNIFVSSEISMMI